MKEHLNLKKDLSGNKKLYVYLDSKVYEHPKFLYEVSIGKYWKYGYCLLSSTHYESDKLLNISKPNEYKRFKDYMIGKSITLIGVPKYFIEENELKLYDPNSKHVRKKKKSIPGVPFKGNK